MELEELLLSLLAFWTLLFVGGMLLYGASKKWRWLVDLPQWLLFLQPGDYLVKSIFGKQSLLCLTYLNRWLLLTGWINRLHTFHHLARRVPTILVMVKQV
jgi:hypothetical protein